MKPILVAQYENIMATFIERPCLSRPSGMASASTTYTSGQQLVKDCIDLWKKVETKAKTRTLTPSDRRNLEEALTKLIVEGRLYDTHAALTDVMNDHSCPATIKLSVMKTCTSLDPFGKDVLYVKLTSEASAPVVDNGERLLVFETNIPVKASSARTTKTFEVRFHGKADTGAHALNMDILKRAQKASEFNHRASAIVQVAKQQILNNLDDLPAVVPFDKEEIECFIRIRGASQFFKDFAAAMTQLTEKFAVDAVDSYIDSLELDSLAVHTLKIDPHNMFTVVTHAQLMAKETARVLQCPPKDLPPNVVIQLMARLRDSLASVLGNNPSVQDDWLAALSPYDRESNAPNVSLLPIPGEQPSLDDVYTKLRRLLTHAEAKKTAIDTLRRNTRNNSSAQRNMHTPTKVADDNGRGPSPQRPVKGRNGNDKGNAAHGTPTVNLLTDETDRQWLNQQPYRKVLSPELRAKDPPFWDGLATVNEAAALSLKAAKRLRGKRRREFVSGNQAKKQAVVHNFLADNQPVANLSRVKQAPASSQLQQAESSMQYQKDNAPMLAFLRANNSPVPDEVKPSNFAKYAWFDVPSLNDEKKEALFRMYQTNVRDARAANGSSLTNARSAKAGRKEDRSTRNKYGPGGDGQPVDACAFASTTDPRDGVYYDLDSVRTDEDVLHPDDELACVLTSFIFPDKALQPTGLDMGQWFENHYHEVNEWLIGTTGSRVSPESDPDRRTFARPQGFAPTPTIHDKLLEELSDANLTMDQAITNEAKVPFIRQQTKALVRPLSINAPNTARSLAEDYTTLDAVPPRLISLLQAGVCLLGAGSGQATLLSYKKITWQPLQDALLYNDNVAMVALLSFQSILIDCLPTSKFSKKYLKPLALATEFRDMVSYLYHVLQSTVLPNKYDVETTRRYVRQARKLFSDALGSRSIPQAEFHDVCKRVLIVRSVVEAIVTLATTLLHLPRFREQHECCKEAKNYLHFKEDATALLSAGAARTLKSTLEEPSQYHPFEFRSAEYLLPIRVPGYVTFKDIPSVVPDIAIRVHPVVTNVFLILQFNVQLPLELDAVVTSPDYRDIVPDNQRRFTLSGSPQQTSAFSDALSTRREESGDLDGVDKRMRRRVSTMEVAVCSAEVGTNGHPRGTTPSDAGPSRFRPPVLADPVSTEEEQVTSVFISPLRPRAESSDAESVDVNDIMEFPVVQPLEVYNNIRKIIRATQEDSEGHRQLTIPVYTTSEEYIRFTNPTFLRLSPLVDTSYFRDMISFSFAFTFSLLDAQLTSDHETSTHDTFNSLGADASFEIMLTCRQKVCQQGTFVDGVYLPIHTNLGAITVTLRPESIHDVRLHPLEMIAFYSLACDMEDRLYLSGLVVNAYLLMHYMMTHGVAHVVLSSTVVAATFRRFTASPTAEGDFPPLPPGTNVRGYRRPFNQPWNEPPPFDGSSDCQLTHIKEMCEMVHGRCLGVYVYDGALLEFSMMLSCRSLDAVLRAHVPSATIDGDADGRTRLSIDIGSPSSGVASYVPWLLPKDGPNSPALIALRGVETLDTVSLPLIMTLDRLDSLPGCSRHRQDLCELFCNAPTPFGMPLGYVYSIGGSGDNFGFAEGKKIKHPVQLASLGMIQVIELEDNGPSYNSTVALNHLSFNRRLHWDSASATDVVVSLRPPLVPDEGIGVRKGFITIKSPVTIPMNGSIALWAVLRPLRPVTKPPPATAIFLVDEEEPGPLVVRLEINRWDDLSCILHFGPPCISGSDASKLSKIAWGHGGSVLLSIHSRSSRSFSLPSGTVAGLYTSESDGVIHPPLLIQEHSSTRERYLRACDEYAAALLELPGETTPLESSDLSSSGMDDDQLNLSASISTIEVNGANVHMGSMLHTHRPQAGMSNSLVNFSKYGSFIYAGNRERPFVPSLFAAKGNTNDYRSAQALVDTGATRSMITWETLQDLLEYTDSLLVAYIPGIDPEQAIPVATYSDSSQGSGIQDTHTSVAIIGQAMITVHWDIATKGTIRRVPIRMVFLVVNRGNQPIIVGADVLRSKHIYPVLEYEDRESGKFPRWILPLFSKYLFHDPLSSFLALYMRDHSSNPGVRNDGIGFLASSNIIARDLPEDGRVLVSRHRIDLGNYAPPNPSSHVSQLRPPGGSIDQPLPFIDRPTQRQGDPNGSRRQSSDSRGSLRQPPGSSGSHQRPRGHDRSQGQPRDSSRPAQRQRGSNGSAQGRGSGASHRHSLKRPLEPSRPSEKGMPSTTITVPRTTKDQTATRPPDRR